jgi:hypothetical protein
MLHAHNQITPFTKDFSDIYLPPWNTRYPQWMNEHREFGWVLRHGPKAIDELMNPEFGRRIREDRGKTVTILSRAS